MESEGVSLPLIHEHLMIPWNSMWKGECCGRSGFTTGGYYCERCNFYVHRVCIEESSEFIEHPSHAVHTLKLRQSKPNHSCDLCGKSIKNLCYCCEICDFDVDLYCAKYPPPEFLDISETHHHKLTLLKVKEFTYYKDKELIKYCDAKCGGIVSYQFHYKCLECDLTFHMDCVWIPPEAKHPSEVNHSYHPLHPLKLHTGHPPDYSDGKCRLCASTFSYSNRLFYHCSACNFSLGMTCVLNPPPQSVMNLKAHDHQLIFRPRLDSFTCNACGLSGDRSPYICLQCDFMIHQGCLSLPRIININRHDHRVSRTSVLGVVNSVCGVCRQKVDWIWGGYSCQRCPKYVVHSKCATRIDVWNRKELEGVPEEIEDIEPYVVIDDNTIQHFSHKEHYLRFHVNGLLCEENKRACESYCMYPIILKMLGTSDRYICSLNCIDHLPTNCGCWCGNDIITYISKTKENPYRIFYKSSIALKRPNMSHFFKWVDEASVEEIKMVDAKLEEGLSKKLEEKLMNKIEDDMGKTALKTICLLSVIGIAIVWLWERI
ncbi:uncharacterized protein LOC17881355 [Capsella rubella]|uniref:uncharacterized protein LOC17881355 n=1 Tax=Capsella rubella TaxID=81985 RepID=UPI000CD4ECEA|nr:uncharacterized protein LOC17881355 [Capsella rubella]